MASLIAQPIAGAQENGVTGFLTGLATGVVSAVALPVTGACVGVYQVGRGVINSGEAVRSSREGMLWDEEKREWYVVPVAVLVTEAVLVAKGTNAQRSIVYFFVEQVLLFYR